MSEASRFDAFASEFRVAVQPVDGGFDEFSAAFAGQHQASAIGPAAIMLATCTMPFIRPRQAFETS